MKIDILQHNLVPEHVILSDEEAEKVLLENDFEADEIPKILPTDPVIIYPLIRSKKLSGREYLLDLITSWGVSQLADYASNTDGYYLVEKDSRQILVRVSKDFITSSELASRVDPKKFIIGNNIFKKAPYQLI